MKSFMSQVSSQAFFEKSGKLPHPYIKLQNSGDDSTTTEMLLAEPPNQQLTRQNMVSQWVAAQDFTKQSSEGLSEETEDKTQASLVNSVAPPATHSADSSKLESGQTETTFLTGTNHVHPGNSEELLKKIMEKVVLFMDKCWSRDPMERPSPNDMLRVSTEGNTKLFENNNERFKGKSIHILCVYYHFVFVFLVVGLFGFVVVVSFCWIFLYCLFYALFMWVLGVILI